MADLEEFLATQLRLIFDRAIHIDGVMPGVPYLSKALAYVLEENGYKKEEME